MTDVRISNVKSFSRSTRSIELSLARSGREIPRWIVVAGRNGAGKSTFLQAIAVAIAGPYMGKLLREGYSDWITVDQQDAISAVRLRFDDGDAFGSGRRPLFDPWAGLQWSREESGPEPSISRYLTGGSWTPARGPWADNPKGWLVLGYGPFRRLSPASADDQRLMMSPGRPTGLASLFREGASLSEAVQWLQQVYLRRLEDRPDAGLLEQLIISLLNDGLMPNGFLVSKVDSDGLWVQTPAGQELPLRSLSDGYRTVAALVLDIVRQLSQAYGGSLAFDADDVGSITIQAVGVVLIDEIDVHLHVEWQQRIGFWLKDHFPGLQFIVTTHSPFICQAADEGGLIRLPNPGEAAPAEIIEGERFNRIVNGNADDALLTDMFGLDDSYSPQASEMRRELSTLETTADLDEQQRHRLDHLRQVLPSTLSDDVSSKLDHIRSLLATAEEQE